MDISVMSYEMKVYFSIACVFTILFLLKMVGLFVGTDVGDGNFGDFDFDNDGGMDSGEAFNVFTVQSALAFGMVFGWVTLAAYSEYEMGTIASLAIGAVAGVCGALLSAFLMKQVFKMNSKVEKQYKVAVGTKAKVHLKVPANGAGFGVIHFTHKQTNYEVKVKTNQEKDIPSHSFVKVVANEPEVVVESVSE